MEFLDYKLVYYVFRFSCLVSYGNKKNVNHTCSKSESFESRTCCSHVLW